MTHDAPRFLADGEIAATRVGKRLQLERAARRARSASRWLVAAGALTIVSGLAVYGSQMASIRAAGIVPAERYLLEDGTTLRGDELLRAAVFATRFRLACNAALAVAFAGLGLWTRRSAIVPPIIALLLWVTVSVLDAVLAPETILQGWLFKILFVAVLVAAAKAGLQARQIAGELVRAHVPHGPAAGWRAEWRNLRAIIVFYVAVAGGIIAVALAVPNAAAAEMVSTAIVAIAACALAAGQREILRPALLLRPSTPFWCLLSFAGGLATYRLISFLVRFLDTSMRAGGDDALGPWRPYAHGLALALLFGAVFPAVFEELAFRGVIQPRLQRYTGPAGAVAGAALMFGSLHMNLGSFAHLTILGLALGLLRLWSGSLWPPMVLHLSHNLWGVWSDRFGAG
ncbi:MAG: CPBP family intramembrane metalloprotease [bacterium]|nr:CPBP family intramembrane metalloprotease [bacterium]